MILQIKTRKFSSFQKRKIFKILFGIITWKLYDLNWTQKSATSQIRLKNLLLWDLFESLIFVVSVVQFSILVRSLNFELWSFGVISFHEFMYIIFTNHILKGSTIYQWKWSDASYQSLWRVLCQTMAVWWMISLGSCRFCRYSQDAHWFGYSM